MRVITGTARGRKLLTPAGNAVRPTADSVKESVFNIIREDVEGRRVLDLFAGTGQLGIEALSRGAAEVIFVDSSAESVALVKKNLELCKMKAQVLRCDALAYLSRGEKFDLIFLDPPYDADLYDKVMDQIILFDILSENGIIVMEARREKVLPQVSAPYRVLKEYNYGKIKICTYTKG